MPAVEEHEPVLTLLFSVMGGEHLHRYIALLPLDASLFSLRLSQQNGHGAAPLGET